ncbi:MAG: lysophospholipase [Ignavibacteria bacterium]|nr:lysophospholipase [Ignavibacteria bacterium]
MILKYMLLLLMYFVTLTAYSQSEIDTIWKGAIDVIGTKIGFTVKFVTASGVTRATMDIPEQSAMGIELNKVSFKNPKVHFELPSSNGIAEFEGLYYGDSIGGTFLQGGIAGRFSLVKGELKTEQTITDPSTLTYNAEEISFSNDGNTFSGTLTYPKTGENFPAVVMITGSGAQNRDEEIFGFKIFGIIADHLTKNGIAVLRYDDRGTGKSKGKTVSESTTEDFAGDVGAAVDFLKTRPEIDAGKIGLFGHSEGGVVGPLTASKRSDIAFLVLMAGTGVKGVDIIKEQSKLIMKAENATDNDVEGYVMMIDMIYETLKKEGNINELESQLEQNVKDSYDKMSAEEKKAIKDKDAWVKETVSSTILQFNNKWMKFFLSYDPVPALTKIKVPVLVLFGEKDLQVPPKQSQKFIEDALRSGGNNDFLVKVFPNANHLFQEAGTGSPNEYAQLPKAFVPGFLDDISEWILQKVK